MEILTKKELAEHLKVTERTIDRLRKQGLPSFKVASGVRFDLSMAMDWLIYRQKIIMRNGG